MIRRLLLATIFVTSGFFAGMVLTGRMKTADEAGAVPRPQQQPAQPEPEL